MRVSLVVFLLVSVCVASAAHAQVPTCAPHQCVPVQPPIDVPIIVGDVEVRSYDVRISVVDGIATVRQTIVVENMGVLPAEMRGNLPLAPGAAVLAFNLTVGNMVYEGVVLARAEAQATYEQAKNESRDAVLLARQDSRLLSLSANVAAGEPRTIQVASVALVPTVAGARVLRVPTSLVDQVDEVSVDVTLMDRYGMHDVRFPEAPLDLVTNTPQSVHASLSAHGAIDDVVAVWREDTREWDIRVMASRDGPDAAVMVRIDHHPGGLVLPRDVAFVLDKSGSMQGSKIQDAREALATALGMLRQGDRFTVHVFDVEVTELTAGLSTTASVAAMEDEVRSVGADGGTDLHAGLSAGLAALPSASDRVGAVVLLSDGLPTAGVTNHARILAEAVAAAGDAAVHVVAIGLDADRTFLEDIARETGGSLTVLQPSDGQLEERLAQLFAQLDRPVARDVTVTFQGLTPRDRMPDPVPVLYEGRTLTMLMRADLPPAWSIRLQATAAGGAVDAVFEVAANDVEVVPDVENLWGAAYVEHLLAQQRRDGASNESKAGIIAAATHYGVVTPYTSWVVVGPPTLQAAASGTTAAGGTGYLRAAPPSGPAFDQGGSDDDDSAAATPGPGVALLILTLALLARRRRSPPF